MENITRFVSLDLSTTKSGIAYWENGEYKESYVIDHDKHGDIDKRTDLMGKDIIRALNYFKPSIVYTEDSFDGKNPKTMKYLSRLHGIAQGWCYINNSEHNLIMPSEWRQYIPGFPNGKGEKRDIQKAYAVKYVTENYGFVPLTDDQADAILIGEGIIRMFDEFDA